MAGPRTFAVDKTPPTIDATPDRNPDQNGWYTGPVQFDFAGHDPISGLQQLGSRALVGGASGSHLFRQAVLLNARSGHELRRVRSTIELLASDQPFWY